MEKIFFHNENIESFQFNRTGTKKKIQKLINNEGRKLGKISIIFCSDEYLLNINNQYLNHDYYTDIVTFNYVEENIISGDLFISIDRIKDNSKDFKVELNEELERVIFHGILHLIGYNDKTDEEIKEMRSKENYYLQMFKNE